MSLMRLLAAAEFYLNYSCLVLLRAAARLMLAAKMFVWGNPAVDFSRSFIRRHVQGPSDLGITGALLYVAVASCDSRDLCFSGGSFMLF